MQKKKRTIFLVLIICLLSISLFIKPEYCVSASDDIEESLTVTTSEIIDSIDLSGLEDIVAGLELNNLFGMSVSEKISSIISGEYFTNYSSIFSAILSLFFIDIRSLLPLIFTILAIGLLSSILNSFKSDSNDTSDMVYFVCYGVVVILILISFKEILSSVSTVISNISSVMQIVFPILITLLVSIGSMSSISIYNPLVAVLTTAVDFVFEKLLYPIFILIFIFTVLGKLTNSIRLDKLNKFFMSTFKWVIGIVLTLFTGFLSIQGISAGRFDSISIKATKFALKSYIPLIGSFVADGMDFIVLGSILVKNTIGLVAIFILFIMIISPIVKMVVYKLLLQLTSGVLEVSGADKMSTFIQDIGKVLLLPIVILIGISFMFIITVALIMCTANVF